MGNETMFNDFRIVSRDIVKTISLSGTIGNSLAQFVTQVTHLITEGSDQAIVSELPDRNEVESSIQNKQCIFESKPSALSTMQ